MTTQPFILPALLLGTMLAAPARAQDAAAPVDPLKVEYVNVVRQPLTFSARLTGTVEARDSIQLSFPSGGRIVEIMVEAGDRVSAGEPLARTDGVQQQQALARTVAGVAAAQAAVLQARQAADRAAALLGRGVGTRAARDAAQQALSSAQGQLEGARTAADQARRAAEDTILKAPQDAVVTARMAEPGQVVGAAQPILSLAALTGSEAVFHIPDSPLLGRAPGAMVELRPIDHPDRHLAGRVSEISPLVDSATGAVTVRVAIEGALDPSLLGAAVVGTVHLPVGSGIELPWTALTATGDGPAVWKIGPDNTVSIAQVTLERYGTEQLVVSAGLSPGDVVVGEGSQLMYPGRPVAPGKARK
ncbi:efflux transporter periplasmic adaptor subunit [Paracoccus contaminans]|uniref:Efflux transporter periplasmic adaptor subunit n=2 Tax=Paracoccus contaminans TaxID=1945662 RepID=A0A1W6D0V7_9RHOB|nr:efflux transporter periplasmic adaptor subunit [Paracoccus contaminans]